MRISELCQMPSDCLIQDASGDWFLRYYQAKMYKEHSIPLAHEVVEVIQEQQTVTRQQWGTSMIDLLPNEDGKVFQSQTFVRTLNCLSYEQTSVMLQASCIICSHINSAIQWAHA